MATDNPEAKRRSRIKLSSRRMMGLVLAVALLLGVWVAYARRIQRRDAAVAAVNQLEGYVWYDHSWMTDPEIYGIAGIPQHAPRLGPWASIDPWLDVVRVAWGEGGMGSKKILNDESRVTDDDLDILKSFPNLWQLAVKNAPKLTDAGLTRVRGLNDLRYLSLGGGQITDVGLVPLMDLSNLTVLVLEDLPVSGEGFRYLSGKPITHLAIWDCPVTDEGLAHLESLPNLKLLALFGTDVTDAGLRRLKGLKNLETLNLSGNQNITDACLAELKTALPNLDIHSNEFPHPTRKSRSVSTNQPGKP